MGWLNISSKGSHGISFWKYMKVLPVPSWTQPEWYNVKVKWSWLLLYFMHGLLRD